MKFIMTCCAVTLFFVLGCKVYVYRQIARQNETVLPKVIFDMPVSTYEEESANFEGYEETVDPVGVDIDLDKFDLLEDPVI